MKIPLRSTIVTVPLTLFFASSVLVSCATDDPNLRTKHGAAIGAIAGAVIGHQLNHDTGSILGGAIGAIAGASAGAYNLPFDPGSDAL